MKSMSDYHDHCSEKGVLLLLDVFEKLIDTCYFSSPRLSRDAMLKTINVKLEKI